MTRSTASTGGQSRRALLRAAAVAGLAAAASSCSSPNEPAPGTPRPSAAGGERATGGRPAQVTPPNIVVVLVDDLGWDSLGCYGNDFVDTPAIDALAASGVRFTQAYSAAPVCSPTRAALVTGLYPARTGITDYLRPVDALTDAFLPPDVPTLPDLVRPQGYTTGLIGKWHLTERYDEPLNRRTGGPAAHGFDDVRLTEEQYIDVGDYVAPYAFMPSVPAKPGEHLTDRLAREAVDFIDDHADEPFVLLLSDYAVHDDLVARPDLLAKYEARTGVGRPGRDPAYAAMVEGVDAQVARVVRALRRRGIAERTLVMVTADNGAQDRAANRPLRGGKGELYEGGIRVPLVVAWASVPGSTTAESEGRVDATVVSTVDLLPTILAVTGRPESPAGLDGLNAAGLLPGGDGSVASRDALFWLYPHHIGGTHPHAAVRSGGLKLVEQLRDGSVELYDLDRDPGERVDLASARPSDVDRLRGMLDRHVVDVGLLPGPPASDTPSAVTTWESGRVLRVPDGSVVGGARVEGGRLVVPASGATVLVRSTQAVAARPWSVLSTAPSLGRGGSSVMLGLAVDAGNHVLFHYDHTKRSVGWDLRVDGVVLNLGKEPLAGLDGTLDLSGPGARMGLSGRGARLAAWADQGRGAGWEFLFLVDIARSPLDLSNLRTRRRLRHAVAFDADARPTVLGELLVGALR